MIQNTRREKLIKLVVLATVMVLFGCSKSIIQYSSIDCKKKTDFTIPDTLNLDSINYDIYYRVISPSSFHTYNIGLRILIDLSGKTYVFKKNIEHNITHENLFTIDDNTLYYGDVILSLKKNLNTLLQSKNIPDNSVYHERLIIVF